MEKTKFITKEQVAAAMKTIVARGEKPTVLATRQELGGRGSMSTICKYMRSIKSADSAEHPESDIVLPEAVEVAFQDAVSKLWETASETASADIETIRQASAKRIETVEQQIEELIDAIAGTEAEREELRAALQCSEDERMSLRNETISLKAKCSQLERWLEDVNKRLDGYMERLEANLSRVSSIQSKKDTSDPS
ncbi:MAG TPA: DNA-binding protein [Gammaproteobacteria bacterium]|nr:DNA-binding protein [Gammaproteobacteria bacterium]